MLYTKSYFISINNLKCFYLTTVLECNFFQFIMAKSLSIIFVSFIFSTSVSFGEDACSHFEDKDCVSPNILQNGHFINQWSVYLPGMTKNQARQILEENGFDYLGQVTFFQVD